MKKNMKRCTNSDCRKLFVANTVCPHCGKQYPRVRTVASEYEVMLTISRRRKASDTGIRIIHILGREHRWQVFRHLHNREPLSAGRFGSYEEAQARCAEFHRIDGVRTAIRRLR